MPVRPPDTIQVVGVYATQWRYPADDQSLKAASFAGTSLAEFEQSFEDVGLLGFQLRQLILAVN